MARTIEVVTISLRLPRWWRAYVAWLWIKVALGFASDVDAAVDLIARHTRYSIR